MKKNMIKVAFVVAVAMVGGITVFNAQKSDVLSDIAMANVEALANNGDENDNSESDSDSGSSSGSDFNCRWDSSYTICYPKGSQLGCPCYSHNW